MEWKFVDGIPIYSQIVNELTPWNCQTRLFTRGEAAVRKRYCSRCLCQSERLVQRALAELEQKRVSAYRGRTNGRFVTEDERALKEIYKEGYQVRILMNTSRSYAILG